MTTGRSFKSKYIFGEIFNANGKKTLARALSAVDGKVDWRRTAVTPVKKQGNCGCCYSFAAAGALEGQIYLKTQKLVNISTQHFLDCVKTNETVG